MVQHDDSIAFVTNKIHHSTLKELYFLLLKSLNLGLNCCKAIRPIFLFLTIMRENTIFFIEVVKCADDGSRKSGENIGFCKESFFTHPPVPEKSKYLSIIKIINRKHLIPPTS
jgi:hypothetical protein